MKISLQLILPKDPKDPTGPNKVQGSQGRGRAVLSLSQPRSFRFSCSSSHWKAPFTQATPPLLFLQTTWRSCVPLVRAVGSTFSEKAFGREKDTFTPESEPHVSKNTFVQNPGPLPQVQPLASAQAKPPVTKAVPDVTSLKHLRPVQVHLPATSTSSLSSMNKSERSARYVSALAKHYFDVLNTKAIDSGWLEPPRPKRKKSKKY